MKLRIQVVVEADGYAAEVLQEIATIERGPLRPDDVGLTLAEAKDLLQGVQQVLVERQVADTPNVKPLRRILAAHLLVRPLGDVRRFAPRPWWCASRDYL